MADLTLLAPQSSYSGLLNLASATSGLTSSLQNVTDGFGNPSPMSISDTEVAFSNATFSGTGAILLPRGTTAQRPSPVINGYLRYNTDTAKVEAYANGSWQNLTA